MGAVHTLHWCITIPYRWIMTDYSRALTRKNLNHVNVTYSVFTLCIQGTGSFIQDKNFRIPDKSPSYSYPLLLATFKRMQKIWNKKETWNEGIKRNVKQRNEKEYIKIKSEHLSSSGIARYDIVNLNFTPRNDWNAISVLLFLKLTLAGHSWNVVQKFGQIKFLDYKHYHPVFTTEYHTVP